MGGKVLKMRVIGLFRGLIVWYNTRCTEKKKDRRKAIDERIPQHVKADHRQQKCTKDEAVSASP